MRVLLDTHVLLWWLNGKRGLSKAQARIIDGVGRSGPLLVAGVSLWEIATLSELGRIELGLPLRDWLERATAPPLVDLVGITPAVAAESAALPSSFHRDPVDRILVATARTLGATLVTADRRIIDAAVVPTL